MVLNRPSLESLSFTDLLADDYESQNVVTARQRLPLGRLGLGLWCSGAHTACLCQELSCLGQPPLHPPRFSSGRNLAPLSVSYPVIMKVGNYLYSD